MSVMQNIKCPDCESGNAQVLGPLEVRKTFADIKIEPLVSHLYECGSCGLGFRSPRLSPNKILSLYASAEIKVWKQYLPTAPWEKIYEHLEKIAPKNLLDFGCFAGDFLKFMPMQCDKFGIEPSIDASIEAQKQGIKILGKTASDLPFDISFDAITLLDVIEHVEQPSTLMNALAERLNPGGILIVLTGAFDGFWFRLLAPRFWYCSISEHLVFISKRWCTRFAGTHDLRLMSYEFIACEPKSISKKLLELARAITYRFVVPALLRVPRIAKIIGMSRLLLWKSAPSILATEDHVIAIFKKI